MIFHKSNPLWGQPKPGPLGQDSLFLKRGACMVKIIRIFMVLLLIPVSIFLMPDRSGGETLFSAGGLAINSWHVHYSFHRFEVDTPGKGYVTLSKTTPEKDIKNGLLIFNEKIILLESFLNGDAVFF